MEIKILDIAPDKLSAKIIELGAKKVFDEDRTITYFQPKDISDAQTTFKLTEEGKLKFSAQETGTGREEIKVFISRKEEFIKILALMGYMPVTRVVARRISFELGTIDFDIDIFPGIPAFLELDVPADSPLSQAEIITQLELQNNQVVTISTPEVFSRYHKDYFQEFAL